MLIRATRLATALTVLVALLWAPAVATAESPRAGSAVAWGPTSGTAGAGGYSITGRLAGPSRQIRLEYKVKGGWRKLDATRSKKHVYGLAGSWDWYGAHKVRLVAPRVKGRPAKVLGKQVLTVVPEYPLRGTSSEFVNFKDHKRIYRFNPCRAVRWRFNSGGGVGDPFLGQIQAALAQVTRASGIAFKYVGTSTTVPLNVKKLEKRTDLVVAFTHDADTPTLAGATAVGGTVRSYAGKGPGPRSWRIDQAGVTISIEQLFSGYYSFDAASTSPTAILVFMHELGHAMGLAHVTSAGSDVEVMYSGDSYIAPWPDSMHYPRWGAGDIAGLSKVGLASGCLR